MADLERAIEALDDLVRVAKRHDPNPVYLANVIKRAEAIVEEHRKRAVVLRGAAAAEELFEPFYPADHFPSGHAEPSNRAFACNTQPHFAQRSTLPSTKCSQVRQIEKRRQNS